MLVELGEPVHALILALQRALPFPQS
jgi:hypothetical protein